MIDKDFCIVVFSHADSPEKEEILFNSLISIKKLNLKIILASHISVSERNQSLCDYFIKDDNNLILTESDILSNPVDDISDNIYNTTDYFGGLKFETYLYKKTYQAGVFNLYIGSFNFAKSLGFKNAILWEYDYILGENSTSSMNEFMNNMISDKLESISFQSIINISNSGVVQKTINCCHAIPTFFNLDKVTSIIPTKFLENAKEYNSLSNLMIIEQWFKQKVINSCDPKVEISYSYYNKYLTDVEIGKVHTQRDNYLLSGLRSGIYISNTKDSACCLFSNMSNCNLKIIFSILDNDNLIWHEEIVLYSMAWSYKFLSKDIFELFNTEVGCKIVESVEEVDSNKIDKFEYIINKNNFDFASKLKVFHC